MLKAASSTLQVKFWKKYELPSLSQLLCSSYSKLQWKHTYVKAVNKFWSKQLFSEIKTKKSLKYLPVDNLRIRSTHPRLDSIGREKGITKARILTGTYLLQKTKTKKNNNRNSFSGGTVDPMCRHCRLEDEDLLHVLARCPAYFEIRKYTVKLLKDIVVRKTNLETWYSYAKDWSVILKVLVCSETFVKALPALQGTEDEIERLSRNCFDKIHVRKLQLENIERSVKMAAHKG